MQILHPPQFVIVVQLVCCYLLFTSLAAEATLGPFVGKNLASCIDELANHSQGGWCEIRASVDHPSISSVWPSNLDRRTRMRTGPSAILEAWNGAAFDEDNYIFYFIGGGHADYGGNEMYKFDLHNGKWERLTDPSPLNKLYLVPSKKKHADKKKYCWAPDVNVAPGAAHSYDGIQFSHATKTIFLAVMGAANGSCFVDKEKKYENNLSI